ncbi:hypothetical protein D3C75_571800 [compost metagenome]
MLQQAGPIGGGEDGEADAAQIEPVNVLQLLADRSGVFALQPVAGGGIIAPVMEGALAPGIGFDEIETGQFVLQPLYQLCVHPFLLPLGQHGVAHGVGAKGSDIGDGQLGVGTGQVDGGVEGVPSKMTHYARLALG